MPNYAMAVLICIIDNGDFNKILVLPLHHKNNLSHASAKYIITNHHEI